MNTQQITDKDVRAFLLATCERLKQFIPGNGMLSVKAEVSLHNTGSDYINWTVYAEGGGLQTQPTLEGAFNAQVMAMSPEMRAQANRAKAQQLIAEAEKLEAQKAA